MSPANYIFKTRFQQKKQDYNIGNSCQGTKTMITRLERLQYLYMFRFSSFTARILEKLT